MKPTSQVHGTPDRLATREEVWRVMDLLRTIAAAREPAAFQSVEFALTFVGSEAANPNGLWLDRCEEESGAAIREASPESLAELFTNRNDDDVN